MYRIIEQAEGCQCVFVLILDNLGSFLEAGKHRTLTTGQVLAGVSVLADLCQHILHEPELIRHKGIGFHKVILAGITLKIQYCTIECKQILQHSAVFAIAKRQHIGSIIGLCQNTLFNNLVYGRRGQAESGVETALDLGKVIAADLGNRVNCLLAGNHHPYTTATLGADFFHDGLQIQHQAAIRTDVLTNLVDHKQQTEIFALGINIFLDLFYKLLNGHIGSFRAVEPVAGSSLAHAQHLGQRINDIILEEGERIPGFLPAFAVEFFKFRFEGIHLTGLFDELLQLRYLQVITVEATVFVKYLCKYTQNSSFILVDGTLRVNVEQNGIRRHSGATLQLRKHHRIVKLIGEIVNRLLSCNGIVGENVRQHFQKVRFTTSKETRDPHANFIRGDAQRLFIVIEKSIKMLTQLSGDNILPQLLLDTGLVSLGNFNNTVNITVNIGFINIL